MVMHAENSKRHTAQPVRPEMKIEGQAQNARAMRGKFAEANAVSKEADRGSEKCYKTALKCSGKCDEKAKEFQYVQAQKYV